MPRNNNFFSNRFLKNGVKNKNNKKKKESKVNIVPGISDPLIFSNHEGENCISSKILFPNEREFIQACFIDPGRVSCAIRIVKYDLETNIIEPLWMAIHNFGTDMPDIILGMERELSHIKDKLILCHHIIIESQLMKSQINYRTFQHMISYIESITRNKGHKAVIFEVCIALKTVMLNGPRYKSQNDGEVIKLWSRGKAREICIRRQDYISYSILVSSDKKQDEDCSDVISYDEAWWLYYPRIKNSGWKRYDIIF